MIHDGSEKPDKVKSQEGADSETFVMGSDAAEFVNKVKDQVRSRRSETMAKRLMSLIARVPSNVSSSTSVSLVKRSHGHQNLWSIAEKDERSGRPEIGIDRKKASDHYYHEQFMESFSSASYSKWDDDRAWSSQEWKTDTEMYERPGRPDETSWRATRENQLGFFHEETHHDATAQSVVNEVMPRARPERPDIDSQGGAWPQQFVIGNDEAELELSVESRSFMNRVNDQVRKRQKRISNITEDGEKHSMIWRMFMTVTMESAVLMGKNFLDNCQSIANTTDLTLKQMFDISTRLVPEQDEISGLETIGWENHSWKYLLLIGDERVINLQRTKVYVFSDSVLCLGKIHRNPESNKAWEEILGWIISSQSYRNFDRIDGEPMEFEWNIFPGFDTLQLSEEVKRLLFRLDETPENFTGRILFMSMFNDISCGTKDNERECLANAKLVSLYARRFGKGQWSFIGPGSEKKRYCFSEDSPQGVWDNIAERMLVEFAESACPIFRATSPLSRGQLKSK